MKSSMLAWALATCSLVMMLGSSSGANAAAVVIRDPAFNLPHVCADTDVDAARQQGYEAMRDRAVQFLLIMNVARGTLHRALGLLGVDADDDISARRSGYARSELGRMFDKLPADGQAIVLAYADGVNAALNDMLKLNPVLDEPLEIRFFKQNAVAKKSNLFGNANVLTQGEGADPYYAPPGTGTYPGSGFQFTPELTMAFAVLQVRDFAVEAWDQIDMAEDLAKLIAVHGVTDGTGIWSDRHWVNDPLSPVSLPDATTPGFGGPLSKLSPREKEEAVAAAERIRDRILGHGRLPGYPQRDYRKVLEPQRRAAAHREATARKWGAWPDLGSYAWMIAPGRSATGNPWLGGFPQTGIEVPSLMHYTEIRGDTITGNGMVFTGAPFVLIGHSDSVAYTTTTADALPVDTWYVETLVGGNDDLFRYDHHGTVSEMAKRVELVYRPTGGPIPVPVFRTNVVCSANGCTGGDRPVWGFSGDVSGTVDAATATSITDNSASYADLSGGYIAITDGTGAGQMRAIASSTTTTINIGTSWTTTPDTTSQYVAVAAGGTITALSRESSVWMDEGTTAYAFSRFQTATNVLDIRDAIRRSAGGQNFFAADNRPHNGIGDDSGTGNIYYGAAGFVRVRQNGLDRRLPLDGAQANAFEIVTGTVGSAAVNALSDPGAFTGKNLAASPVNWTYTHPGQKGSDYIVVITAGDGYRQARRILTNTADTLTIEHDWSVVPSVGDTYSVYEIWAMPEVVNPSEQFAANWDSKLSVATDQTLYHGAGRNVWLNYILENLSLDSSIDRADQRTLNRFLSGAVQPGNVGRYLLPRVTASLGAYGACADMTVYNDLIVQNDFPLRGREFENPLVGEPDGVAGAAATASRAADYLKDWSTVLAQEIYGDEFAGTNVGLRTGKRSVAWVLHAIDGAAGDVANAYTNAYAGDYFNGLDWKQVVRDSFCNYVAAHPTVGTKNRRTQWFDHPLSDLPCQSGCATPIEFDPTPYGERGTYEQIIEVGADLQGEFIYPLGQSSFVAGNASGFTGNNVKQAYHTATLHPVWRDWRFVPMLQVCRDVTLGGDEDGDTDGDGVLDAFERWYYGDLSQDASSDTDGDGADLMTEYRWGSSPTEADTDLDTVPDGSDVAPQDRLCVAGTLKRLAVKDSAKAGKDKVRAKWSVPLRVCVGSDYRGCTTDADCPNGLGQCRQIRLNPQLDPLRVVAADDTPLFDADVPISKTLWKNRNGVKFKYKDKDAVNGSLAKASVRLDEKKGVVLLSFAAKKFDLPAAPDAAQGVVGMAVGSRCFMETTTNCKQKAGKLVCKAEKP